MGRYSVPPGIRAMRPKGTQVKRQGDLFYAYETASTKRKAQQEDGSFKWKTVTKSGRCLGRITARDGFIPNTNKLADDEITVLGHGGHAFAMKASRTLAGLKATFNAIDANWIYVAALIAVADGFAYMKGMGNACSESFLSLEFPCVQLGEKALRALYENPGKRNGKAARFQQPLIQKSSKKLAFDGHVIACASEKNDLSEYGYKAKKLNSPQINWMTACDVQTGKPLANEMLNGSDPGKTAVQQFFGRFTFKDMLFIVDRGFDTATDKKPMPADGNSCIVPMTSGRSDYAHVLSNLKIDRRKSFIYDKDGYPSLIYCQEFRKDGKRCIACIDTTRQSAERKTYVENKDAGKKGFTEEGLLENEPCFGLFLLEASGMEKHPKEVFCDYKGRWKIETFYSYIDNVAGFNALYRQDYCRTQGLSFVVQVAGMVYHEIKDLADSKTCL